MSYALIVEYRGFNPNILEDGDFFDTLEELFDYAEHEFTMLDAYDNQIVIYEGSEERGFSKIGYVSPAPRKFIFEPLHN